MIWIAVFFAVVALITTAFAFFLLDESKKKGTMINARLEKEPNVMCWYYEGCTEFNMPPHMRKVVITSSDQQSFALTVYLLLKGKRADPFVFVPRDNRGKVVIKMYIGPGPATIFFEPTPSVEIHVNYSDSVQYEIPDITVEPHWFQKGLIWAVAGRVANLLNI